MKKTVPRVRLTHRCGFAFANITPSDRWPLMEAGEHSTWFEVQAVGKTSQRIHFKDPQVDGGGSTYTWGCRCGQTVTLRRERLAGLWKQYLDGHETGVARVVVDA